MLKGQSNVVSLDTFHKRSALFPLALHVLIQLGHSPGFLLGALTKAASLAMETYSPSLAFLPVSTHLDKSSITQRTVN